MHTHTYTYIHTHTHIYIYIYIYLYIYIHTHTHLIRFVSFLFLELYDVCEILHGEFGMMQSGLTSRSVEIKNADYLVSQSSFE